MSSFELIRPNHSIVRASGKVIPISDSITSQLCRRCPRTGRSNYRECARLSAESRIRIRAGSEFKNLARDKTRATKGRVLSARRETPETPERRAKSDYSDPRRRGTPGSSTRRFAGMVRENERESPIHGHDMGIRCFKRHRRQVSPPPVEMAGFVSEPTSRTSADHPFFPGRIFPRKHAAAAIFPWEVAHR